MGASIKNICTKTCKTDPLPLSALGLTPFHPSVCPQLHSEHLYRRRLAGKGCGSGMFRSSETVCPIYNMQHGMVRTEI